MPRLFSSATPNILAIGTFELGLFESQCVHAAAYLPDAGLGGKIIFFLAGHHVEA